jgi:hypothetical protein
MLTEQQLIDIETGAIKTLQGGRIEKYTDSQLCWQAGKYNTIGLYSGTRWVPVSPPTGIVLSNLSPTTISGATLASGINYDVYARYQSDTNFTLEFQEWASNNARYQDPVWSDGVLVYGTTASGKGYRYLGAVRLDGVTGIPKFMDSFEKRFVVNWYNTKPAAVRTYNSSLNIWTYSVNTGLWYEYGTNMADILAAQIRGEFLSIHKNVDISGAFVISRENRIQQYYGFAMALNSTSTPLNSWSWCDENGQTYNDRFAMCASSYGTPLLGYNWITIVCKLTNDQAGSAPPSSRMSIVTPGDAGGGMMMIMV